jgi:hypothetical protein
MGGPTWRSGRIPLLREAAVHADGKTQEDNHQKGELEGDALSVHVGIPHRRSLGAKRAQRWPIMSGREEEEVVADRRPSPT